MNRSIGSLIPKVVALGRKPGGFVFAAVLLAVCLGCAASRPGVYFVPESQKTEGNWNVWLESIGLFRYGISLEEAQGILGKTTFCGSRFMLKEIPWPMKNQVPPAEGPYYGVFEVLPDGHEKTPWMALLISSHGIMTHGAKFMLGGTTVQWFPLIGHPAVLAEVRGREDAGQRAFARMYWTHQRSIKSYLSAPRSLSELKGFLDGLMAQTPPGFIGYEEAKEPYLRFRDNAEEESLIRCAEFEGSIQWDSIWGIWMDESSFSYFHPDGSDGKFPLYRDYAHLSQSDRKLLWSLDCLANIYVKDGRVVGVLFRESSYFDCVPRFSFPCRSCNFYPDDTLLYWALGSHGQ